MIWDEGDDKVWYIGLYLDSNEDGTFRVDHLARAEQGDDVWQRPPGDDIQDTTERQIVPVAVLGTWEFSRRKPCFVLSNAAEIQETFLKIYSA